MKKLILFLATLTGAFSSWGIQPEEDSLHLNEDNVQIHIEEISFSFENAVDSLTLKPFSYGNLKIGWENIEGDGNILGIKYRNNSDEWSYHFCSADSTVTVIEELEENLIFNYQLGIGSSKSNVEYLETDYFFHTFSESIFENNSAKGKVEAAEISWAIPNIKLNEILEVYPQATYSIKYNTKIGEKQNKSDKTKSPWIQMNHISPNTVKYKIQELVGGEKYVYKVGLDLGDEIIWSQKHKFSVERRWGIFKLLLLIGALGLFIFGMKIMSEGLQKAAGSRLRNMLASITSNRFKGVLTGLGITSVVQSSSVTTVMTVSFVNAGLMTLKQSAGVIMGANIGTTMTAWLILIFGFKVDIAGYALVLIAFGAPLLFFSKASIRNWAAVIIGFSLLFMGLGFLKANVPEIGADSPLVQFFVDYRDSGLLGTLMFIGFGTLATVIIQSSSATMALTMTMVAGGVLPFEVAAAMILGENIGTTITAQLAALIGNVHAKRAARIHAFFNLIGVVWCVIIFHFFLNGVAFFVDGDPFSNPEDANEGLALFHSVFNIVNVLLLVWFVPRLVKLAEKSVRSKGASDEEFHLDYIGTGMMGTPDLSIMEAKKEVAKFGEITSRMSTFTQQLLTEQNKKKKTKLHEKIAKYEEITDRVEIEVANYLAKVSSGDMTEETATRIRQMNSIVNDLERIGDIFFQMSKAIERKDLEKVYFLPEQRTNLLEMFKLIDNAFDVMIKNLKADWTHVTYNEALEIEELINEKRDEMRGQHFENMNVEGFNMNSGMIYNNLFSSCEKIGDHIINVTEAIAGNIE
jgi:phosphate:Na+ symporter